MGKRNWLADSNIGVVVAWGLDNEYIADKAAFIRQVLGLADGVLAVIANGVRSS